MTWLVHSDQLNALQTERQREYIREAEHYRLARLVLSARPHRSAVRWFGHRLHRVLSAVRHMVEGDYLPAEQVDPGEPTMRERYLQ